MIISFGKQLKVILMSIKSLKTPLRYPGGKSKAIKTLSQWYPKIISEYREPFTVSYTHLTLPTKA